MKVRSGEIYESCLMNVILSVRLACESVDLKKRAEALKDAVKVESFFFNSGE